MQRRPTRKIIIIVIVKVTRLLLGAACTIETNKQTKKRRVCIGDFFPPNPLVDKEIKGFYYEADFQQGKVGDSGGGERRDSATRRDSRKDSISGGRRASQAAVVGKLSIPWKMSRTGRGNLFPRPVRAF